MDEGAAADDPRMRGFRSRMPVETVLALIDERVTRLEPEDVPLVAAAGRILARDMFSSVDVPGFDRASMDGYACRGEDTFGADVYAPVPLRLVGRARPGQDDDFLIQAGEAVEIATGAAMPPGSDAVVKVEATRLEAGQVWVTEPTPPGRHVGRRGEDIETGMRVLPSGRHLRPQDVGVLSAIGMPLIPVIRRPRVTIVVTGDELLPAGSRATGRRIADANAPMLASLVSRDGGVPIVVGPLPDDRERIQSAISHATRHADLVLVSGGSSTGPEDHAPGIVAELGELLAHGVAIRPASPAGLGMVEGVLVVLLPGNPVSCLCAYDFFAGRIVRVQGGRTPEWPYRRVDLPLRCKLSSALGRVDYARVTVANGGVEPLAISGASILSSTTRADGFVVVPAGLEGYPAGARVTVWLYD
jgi:molybdopterin molybdotransferase